MVVVKWMEKRVRLGGTMEWHVIIQFALTEAFTNSNCDTQASPPTPPPHPRKEENGSVSTQTTTSQ